MPRLIDADALKELLVGQKYIPYEMDGTRIDVEWMRGTNNGIRIAIGLVDRAPTVTHVKHGHWVITTEGYWNEDGDVATAYTVLAKAHCSKCGFGFRNGMVIVKNSEENPYLYSKEKAVDWIPDFARMEREAIDKARDHIDLPYCGKCGSRMENVPEYAEAN